MNSNFLSGFFEEGYNIYRKNSPNFRRIIASLKEIEDRVELSEVDTDRLSYTLENYYLLEFELYSNREIVYQLKLKSESVTEQYNVRHKKYEIWKKTFEIHNWVSYLPSIQQIADELHTMDVKLAYETIEDYCKHYEKYGGVEQSKKKLKQLFTLIQAESILRKYKNSNSRKVYLVKDLQEVYYNAKHNSLTGLSIFKRIKETLNNPL